MEIVPPIKINVNSVVQPRRNSLSVNSSMDIESLKGQKLERVSLLEDKPQLWDYYNEGEIKMIKVKKWQQCFLFQCTLSVSLGCFMTVFWALTFAVSNAEALGTARVYVYLYQQPEHYHVCGSKQIKNRK